MMSRKFFKKDQNIKCIDVSNVGSSHKITLGEVYTVLKDVETYDFDNQSEVFILDDSGKRRWYYVKRFETLEDNKKSLTLPTDSDARKEIPMFSGCIKYFPAAIAGVAKISKIGNDKHNPGKELHHDRTKSLDHADCIVRHLTDVADLIASLERGETTNPEMILAEVSSLAWRALAYSQTLHEKYDGAPLAPGAKINPLYKR